MFGVELIWWLHIFIASLYFGGGVICAKRRKDVSDKITETYDLEYGTVVRIETYFNEDRLLICISWRWVDNNKLLVGNLVLVDLHMFQD